MTGLGVTRHLSRLPSWRQFELAQRETDALLASAARSDGPILVGPWLAEIGFELLYWIPFVRNFVRRGGIDPQRLVVVSRGGVASWYEGVHGRYVELFDLLGPEEFRAGTEDMWERGGGRKHLKPTGWEGTVLDRALGTDWRSWFVLHPSLMNSVFRLWWRSALPVSYVLDRIDVEPLRRPDDAETEARLPESFVAVRFYSRPSFPDTPENRRLANEVVSRLAAAGPVVLLNTSFEVDDHLDLEPDADERVLRLLDGVPPERNLLVQSVAISRARAFAGTYGGLAYLAPLYGIPSFAYASTTRPINPTHMAIERRELPLIGGSLTLLDGHTEALAGLLAA